jgi:hypothetical protein
MINTYGFEKEENEHDVDDKVYPELSPMLNPTGMVRILRDRAGDIHKFACLDSFEWEVSLYIEELERRIEELERRLVEK